MNTNQNNHTVLSIKKGILDYAINKEDNTLKHLEEKVNDLVNKKIQSSMFKLDQQFKKLTFELEYNYIKKKMCKNGPNCKHLFVPPFKCKFGHTKYEVEKATPWKNNYEDATFMYIEEAKIEEEDYIEPQTLRNCWTVN